MTEWFRNTGWDEGIEAAFDSRLARTRGQKAQYLRIQGSILKDTHPVAALGLLQRCIDLGDDLFIAPALLDAAQAHYKLGDVEQALACLEAAIDQEGRHPSVRTSAAFDYLMLVVLHERAERYDRAFALLEQARPALFPAMAFQREAARAVILATRGEHAEARAAARRALAAEAIPESWIPSHPDVGLVPNATNPLSFRMREIAALAEQ